MRFESVAAADHRWDSAGSGRGEERRL